MQKMLKNILTSKVYEAAIETPLDEAPILSQQLGNRVFLKREDLQPVFSFKLRGAYNRIAHLDQGEKERGVIAASAGNHAQGVAFAARALGISALIVMPKTTPKIKIEAVQSLGAEVRLHGDNYSEAAELCERLIAESGQTFIHPFDDELVIAGQGTVADELLRQTSGDMDAIFVPIGGGGLIAGIATFIKALSPATKVIGVEPEESAAMFHSLQAGKRIRLERVGIFADGVAVRQVGALTFDLCRRYVDDILLVSNDEICSSIKAVFQSTRSIVEPSGALALAGLKKYVRTRGVRGQTLIAVNSGANMNFERLRYIAELTMIGERQEALFAITIPEAPGALRRFCDDFLLERNITEFNYRLSGRYEAHIYVGISLAEEDERYSFARQLKQAGYGIVDLTDNDLAKTHVRYMVGGRSPEASDEVLYRFWFPERPGALGDFLSAMGESWNISLFHYRTQGGDFGRVLVGLEIPENEKHRIPAFLDDLGYDYIEETENAAYRLFL